MQGSLLFFHLHGVKFTFGASKSDFSSWNLLLETPGAPSGGSSSFPRCFPQCSWELKSNFKPEFFCLLKSWEWEKQNSNPEQEEFPGWKVKFPFLRYFPHLKMQHFYIHHPGGKENPFRLNYFRKWIRFFLPSFFHISVQSESCLKNWNKTLKNK